MNSSCLYLHVSPFYFWLRIWYVRKCYLFHVSISICRWFAQFWLKKTNTTRHCPPVMYRKLKRHDEYVTLIHFVMFCISLLFTYWNQGCCHDGLYISRPPPPIFWIDCLAWALIVTCPLQKEWFCLEKWLVYSLRSWDDPGEIRHLTLFSVVGHNN